METDNGQNAEFRNRILEAKLDACHKSLHKIGMASVGRWDKRETISMIVDSVLEAVFNEQERCQYDSLRPPDLDKPPPPVKKGKGGMEIPSGYGDIPLAGTGR